MRIGSELPDGFDHRVWVDRWDAMQDYYFLHRSERLRLLTWLVTATQERPRHVLDLGCGTGTVMQAMLDAVPGVQVTGVDLDESLLLLARFRLSRYGDRARVVRRDFRDPDWPDEVGGPVDGVVSAGALHWLAPDGLTRLYGQVARVLRPGGLFANADHVGSRSERLQRSWEQHSRAARDEAHPGVSEAWGRFWASYGAALGIDDPDGNHRDTFGPWRGVEEGMPLVWHLRELTANGFGVVECFWRLDGDAVYGGLRS